MNRSLLAVAGLAVTSIALLLGSATTTSVQAAPGSGVVPAATTPQKGAWVDSPIQHVVIIYQENHSFDDVLGPVCEARANPCNGYTGPVTFHDGKTATNIVQPDVVPEVDHSPRSQQRALHDRWDLIPGCLRGQFRCVSHVDPANIPNLAALADTFSVSDATFAAGHAASFGAHVTLAAGRIAGFAGTNPVNSRTGVKPRAGWGCPSRRDALWGPANKLTYQPSCIPDVQGKGPYRKSEVSYVPTIMERLEAAGLSWHVYAGTDEKKPSRAPLSVCTYFYWCYNTRFDLAHNSSRGDFGAAALAGTLPTLSFVIPIGDVSQHNGMSMAVGDNYIGKMVSSVENGPNWGSTAIFITYDDCGCFYDHVKPPSPSYGLRNPMVIVSPYAKPQGTDSTTAIQPYSMLAFVQDNFGLPSLSLGVDAAYDYENAFDFTQRPLRGPVMTTQVIPKAEQVEMARLRPAAEDDPT